jgi:Leucine-rich repeat (LRR) protein
MQVVFPGNKLQEIPSEIWRCTALQTLDLGNNSLAALDTQVIRSSSPGEQQATCCETNCWRGNQQFSYSGAVGRAREQVSHLGSLTNLFLSGNKLSALPDTLTEIRGLKRIELTGNPMGQDDHATGVRLSSCLMPCLVVRIGTSACHLFDLFCSVTALI